MGTLRLTGGTLRSRSVRTPSGRAVRPTPARVKEALFSILADRLDNANVLDIATSISPRLAAAVRAVAVVVRRAHRRADHQLPERAARMVAGRFDLVFADPPYAQPYPAATFATLRERGSIDERSLVVYEHSSRLAAPVDPGFALQRAAAYGEVALAFLQPEPV